MNWPTYKATIKTSTDVPSSLAVAKKFFAENRREQVTSLLRERERGQREEGREERQGGKEGRREGGKEGRREGGKEGASTLIAMASILRAMLRVAQAPRSLRGAIGHRQASRPRANILHFLFEQNLDR